MKILTLGRYVSSSGWEKVTGGGRTVFVANDIFPVEVARRMLRDAVEGGITLLKTEQPEYLDGGGVLVGAKVGVALHEATIPSFNERLDQQTRFDAVRKILGDFPSDLDAYEIIE